MRHVTAVADTLDQPDDPAREGDFAATLGRLLAPGEETSKGDRCKRRARAGALGSCNG